MAIYRFFLSVLSPLTILDNHTGKDQTRGFYALLLVIQPLTGGNIRQENLSQHFFLGTETIGMPALLSIELRYRVVEDFNEGFVTRNSVSEESDNPTNLKLHS